MSRSQHSGQISLRENINISGRHICEKRHSIPPSPSPTFIYTLRQQNVWGTDSSSSSEQVNASRVYDACMEYTEHTHTASTATTTTFVDYNGIDYENRHNNHWFKFSSYMDNRFVCYFFPLFYYYFPLMLMLLLASNNSSLYYYCDRECISNSIFTFISHTLPRTWTNSNSVQFCWMKCRMLHSRHDFRICISFFPFYFTVNVLSDWLSMLFRRTHASLWLHFNLTQSIWFVRNVLLNFKSTARMRLRFYFRFRIWCTHYHLGRRIYLFIILILKLLFFIFCPQIPTEISILFCFHQIVGKKSDKIQINHKRKTE